MRLRTRRSIGIVPTYSMRRNAAASEELPAPHWRAPSCSRISCIYRQPEPHELAGGDSCHYFCGGDRCSSPTYCTTHPSSSRPAQSLLPPPFQRVLSSLIQQALPLHQSACAPRPCGVRGDPGGVAPHALLMLRPEKTMVPS